jgi:Heterokaryon incompatibility protein (HET)
MGRFSKCCKFVQIAAATATDTSQVCISQVDKQEKEDQIRIMNSIYKGGWATIVALSGMSAYSGLPRVNSKTVGSQNSCLFGTIQLATVGPTLKQQIDCSKWATRAWTYQEAILSPRCIYFTPSQVYFECNMFQCAESLNETESPFHNIEHEERCNMVNSCVCHGITPQAYGSGIFRDPLSDTDENGEYQIRKFKHEKYNALVEEYSLRESTYASDRINAFEAVMQQLQHQYFKKGFYWGLPIESMPWALL